jgi:DNA-binding transcriptional regulator of glucitol operon
VSRRYSFAARPGWVAFHLFTVAAIVTMILLGRWQLHVSEAKHFNIQNFGYTLQWWAFSAFAAYFWWRIVRDHARRDDVPQVTPEHSAAQAEAPVAYRRYVAPSATAAVDDSDPVRAAYNDYLAGLAARDAKDSNEERT